jgi:hypothetical protein
MPTVSARITEALADLAITFLPLTLVFLVLGPLGRLNEVGAEFSLLVAVLFTDGAWRARRFPTERPTERWSVILIGCWLGLASSVAGVFHLLGAHKAILPELTLRVTAFASQVDMWLFPVAIAYGLYVRYKCT